jgi:DNA repair exonuclease SbcCD ATPase subunit
MSLTDLLGRRPSGKAPATESDSQVAQLRAEREAIAELLEQARAAKRDLGDLTQVVDQARQAAHSVDSRTGDLDRRLRVVEDLATRLPGLEEQAQAMGNVHRRVEKQLSTAAADADRVTSQVADLRDTMETAVRLKQEMAQLLAKADVFTQLRAQADEFTGVLRNLHSNFAQIRSQHDAVMQVYQGAASRLEKFDDQFRRMSDGVGATDRRAEELERKLRDLSSVADGMTDTKRQLDTLNALAGLVTRKIAAVEQQKEAVERAATEAANLQALVKQISAETERQHEKARGLAEFEQRLDEVRKAHEAVLSRTSVITAEQAQIEAAVSGARGDLSDLRTDLKKAGDRFELENRGLDNVGQRIVGLRTSLMEVEERFQVLERSRSSISEAEAAAAAVASQLETVATDVKAVEAAVDRVQAIGSETERLDASLATLTDRMGRIDQARPAIEAAMSDLTELRQSREAVRDALEQMRISHAEITRFRESHWETETWLEGVQESLHGVEAQVQFLDGVRPLVDQLGKDVERVMASVEAVESRRQFVEQLHSRLAEVASRSGQVEDRTQQLERRMEAAEKRFVSLSLQADDAERVARVVFGVTRQVEDSERRMTEIVGSIGSTEGRFREVEALAERVRQIGADLEQRENALQRAAEQLQKASTLRNEGAAMLQEMEAQTRKLMESLAKTEARTARVDVLASQLEERASGLRFVERRMAQFEEQLAKWELADQEVRRALEDIAQRQATIDGLRADIQHMFALAERTMENVRSVGEAREEVRGTHELVQAALQGVADGKRVVEHLEWRKGQLDQIEGRLARADALVIDLDSSLETLETQRAVVEQVISQAGALEFQSKQAEALLETLRQERELATRIQSAIWEARKQREVSKTAS